jgi:hypothetical protein
MEDEGEQWKGEYNIYSSICVNVTGYTLYNYYMLTKKPHEISKIQSKILQ